jgi:hypothetical protein
MMLECAGEGHARDQTFRGHGPVTILHLLQQIADCLLLVLLHGFSPLALAGEG